MIRQIIKSFIFTLLVFVTFGKSYSQNLYDLEVKSLSFQDSATFNEDVSVAMFVKNNSGQSFNGNLQIQYMFTQQLPNGNSNLVPSKVLNLNNVTIPVGDSINVNDLINTNPNRFGGGNNIVIVWPKYRNQVFNDINPNNDVKNKNIFIKSNGNGNGNIPSILSTKDLKNKTNKIEIYPNPFTESITLENLKNGSTVTLFNIVGEEVFISTNIQKSTSTFDVSSLNKGIYFIKVENESEPTFYKKIIKK